MDKPKRKVMPILASALIVALLLVAVYAYKRSQFISKANAVFDPQQKAFKGTFLPWPIGRPTLLGFLDPETDRRLRSALAYESGSIKSNGMTLIIHNSDGTFLVHGI
jgi:hypothetical protein